MLGYAQDRRRSIGLALITGGFVLGGIPSIGDLQRGLRHGNALVIARRRCDHAIAPVLRHYGNPVTGEVDGSGGFRIWRRASGAGGRLCEQGECHRDRKPENFV